MSVDRTKNSTIILYQEDIKNPLHPLLWYDILETLNVDSNATEICLQLSPLDHNEKSNDKE